MQTERCQYGTFLSEKGDEAEITKIHDKAAAFSTRLQTERNGELLRYHALLQSICQIVKAGDERSSKFSDTLRKPQLLFEEEWKVRHHVQCLSNEIFNNVLLLLRAS